MRWGDLREGDVAMLLPSEAWLVLGEGRPNDAGRRALRVFCLLTGVKRELGYMASTPLGEACEVYRGGERLV